MGGKETGTQDRRRERAIRWCRRRSWCSSRLSRCPRLSRSSRFSRCPGLSRSSRSSRRTGLARCGLGGCRAGSRGRWAGRGRGSGAGRRGDLCRCCVGRLVRRGGRRSGHDPRPAGEEPHAGSPGTGLNLDRRVKAIRDRAADGPAVNESHKRPHADSRDDEGLTARYLGWPDRGAHGAIGVADPIGATSPDQRCDGDWRERSRRRAPAAAGDLNGTRVDPELGETLVGARDAVEPADHDRHTSVGVTRDRERRRGVRRTQDDHRRRARAENAEACAADRPASQARPSLQRSRCS